MAIIDTHALPIGDDLSEFSARPSNREIGSHRAARRVSAARVFGLELDNVVTVEVDVASRNVGQGVKQHGSYGCGAGSE